MDIIAGDWIMSFRPVLWAQSTSLPVNFFNPKSYDSTTLTICLAVLLGMILLVMIVALRYKRWRQFNMFLEEMRSLDLDPSSEGTFAWMVKRYRMNEPVKVLRSRQVFDEMATGEIFRVLCSAGTMQAKENFIDTIYDIRKRTFNPKLYFRQEEKQ